MTTPGTPPKIPPTSESDSGAVNFNHLKKLFGLYTEVELARRIRKLPEDAYLVEGLLSACSVNLLVGDSGIGKSALVYQLALAVASGKPFLGQPCRTGKVVLVDYENSMRDSHRMLVQQRRHLGLAAPPFTLLVWPMNQESPETSRDELQKQGLHQNVEQVIYHFAPDLVIFDSLRSFHPTMETDNCAAVKEIKELRTIARCHRTAILLVHHVRKQSLRTAPSLEDGPPLDWMIRSAGARALINQTDARLAISTRENAGNDGDTLVLRGHLRTQGEVGPYLIQRLWDGAGEPLGYQRIQASPKMLQNAEQEQTLARLPQAFSFGEARDAYGKQNNATSCFLLKLIRLGLVAKTGHGKYRQVKCGTNTELSEEAPTASAA